MIIIALTIVTDARSRYHERVSYVIALSTYLGRHDQVRDISGRRPFSMRVILDSYRLQRVNDP